MAGLLQNGKRVQKPKIAEKRPAKAEKWPGTRFVIFCLSGHLPGHFSPILGPPRAPFPPEKWLPAISPAISRPWLVLGLCPILHQASQVAILRRIWSDQTGFLSKDSLPSPRVRLKIVGRWGWDRVGILNLLFSNKAGFVHSHVHLAIKGECFTHSLRSCKYIHSIHASMGHLGLEAGIWAGRQISEISRGVGNVECSGNPEN